MKRAIIRILFWFVFCMGMIGIFAICMMLRLIMQEQVFDYLMTASAVLIALGICQIAMAKY